jgi:hypothetical protein
MTVRRFTAQCLPPLRNKRNSTGDCHAAEFQTPSASHAFEYASSMTLIERPAAGTPHSLNCYRDLSRSSPPATGKSVPTALNSGRVAPVAVLSVEHGTVARRI